MAKDITTHHITWRGISLRVRHERRVYDYGADRVQLWVIAPPGAEIPITADAYLSCFVDEDEIAAAGGAVSYVIGWLDREADTPAWRKRELKRQQLSFDFD